MYFCYTTILICYKHNLFGFFDRFCYFDVALIFFLLIEPSGTPKIISVLAESSNSVRIIWLAVPFNERNGIITQHRVEIRERVMAQSLLSPFYRTATEEDTIVVTGLKPYTTYSFRVEASTAVGRGNFSSSKEGRTHDNGTCVLCYNYRTHSYLIN